MLKRRIFLKVMRRSEKGRARSEGRVTINAQAALRADLGQFSKK